MYNTEIVSKLYVFEMQLTQHLKTGPSHKHEKYHIESGSIRYFCRRLYVILGQLNCVSEGVGVVH